MRVMESAGSETNFIKFVTNFYGVKKRKGIDKLALSHPMDVIRNMELEYVDSFERGARLYKLGMLHDMLEDGDISPENLANMLALDERELHVLKLVSRNIENSDKSSYIEGIMEDDDAIIVKFADRISNILDLIRWIKEQRGFNISSLATTTRYLSETEEMLDRIGKRYPNLLKDPKLTHLSVLYIRLNNRLIDLERIFKTYKDIEVVE